MEEGLGADKGPRQGSEISRRQSWIRAGITSHPRHGTPLPPQPRLYVDPLTHWWGLESLPYARTWGGHHCTLAVSLGLGVVGEAGAGLGPFPYSY